MWVKTIEGDLINLNNCIDVHIFQDGDMYRVEASTAPNSVRYLTGLVTKEEAQRVLRQIEKGALPLNLADVPVQSTHETYIQK